MELGVFYEKDEKKYFAFHPKYAYLKPQLTEYLKFLRRMKRLDNKFLK